MNRALHQFTVRPLHSQKDKTNHHLIIHLAARDCAVTHNNIALICRPGVEEHQEKGKTKDKEREKESKNMAREQDCASVRAVLKKELGLTVVDLESPEARLSGSDVLFTGR